MLRRGGVFRLGVLAMLCGCAGAANHGDWNANELAQRSGPDRDPDLDRWLIVQFQSAALPPVRPDGTAWHRSKADNTSVVLGGLFGLAIGYPSVGLSLGKALADEGGDPLAPAPYVILKVAGRSFRISAVDRTYSPRWDQPIMVDTRSLQPIDQVIVQVMDGVDDSLMGQREYQAAEFLVAGSRTLTAIGGVASLDVAIQSAPPRGRTQFDIEVPSTLSLQALVEGRSAGWAAIPVWNGDTVTVTASGSVCPSTRSNQWFGPDGIANRWRSYSYDGFKDFPHASLVAIFPGVNYFIGSSRRLEVTQSGNILLFVNDADEDNDSGSFQVHVVVDPPS